MSSRNSISILSILGIVLTCAFLVYWKSQLKSAKLDYVPTEIDTVITTLRAFKADNAPSRSEVIRQFRYLNSAEEFVESGQGSLTYKLRLPSGTSYLYLRYSGGLSIPGGPDVEILRRASVYDFDTKSLVVLWP